MLDPPSTKILKENLTFLQSATFQRHAQITHFKYKATFDSTCDCYIPVLYTDRVTSNIVSNTMSCLENVNACIHEGRSLRIPLNLIDLPFNDAFHQITCQVHAYRIAACFVQELYTLVKCCVKCVKFCVKCMK